MSPSLLTFQIDVSLSAVIELSPAFAAVADTAENERLKVDNSVNPSPMMSWRRERVFIAISLLVATDIRGLQIQGDDD